MVPIPAKLDRSGRCIEWEARKGWREAASGGSVADADRARVFGMGHRSRSFLYLSSLFTTSCFSLRLTCRRFGFPFVVPFLFVYDTSILDKSTSSPASDPSCEETREEGRSWGARGEG